MTLRISGTNFDIGESLRKRIEERIENAVDKYFSGGFSGHVNLTKQNKNFRAECRVHLDSRIDLAATATDMDATRSFDMMLEKIEKRLRRYKRRLKDHHSRDNQNHYFQAADYVIDAGDEEKEIGDEDSPLIIAETETIVKTMTVSMAMMDLDLKDAPVIMFKNAANGGLNVVYRRADGNIGWIDPNYTTPES